MSELKRYKCKFEEYLLKKIPLMGVDSPLRKACEYALLSDGKRLRPAITLMIADALGKGQCCYDSAFSIECFHTASLIADDLPCIDDDDERRGRPSTHKAFNEATALLASYALISAGYRGIYENSKSQAKNLSDSSQDVCSLALENATYNTGLCGATGGQFLDIYPPDRKLQTLQAVTHAKTVTLFEIAFVYGWLFGGGDKDSLEVIKQAAWHFGMAFQIADDFSDACEDAERGCETNFVVSMGYEEATRLLDQELAYFRKILEKLNLLTPAFIELIDLLILTKERAKPWNEKVDSIL